MRTLEHRRHSRRDRPGGVHLNVAGLALAQRVAPTLPRFDRVVTSPLPRAVETAQALGFTVDDVLPDLAHTPGELESVWDEVVERGFPAAVELVDRSPAVAAFGRAQAELWARELLRVPDGGHLLMVSHGGVIEVGTVSAMPDRSRGLGPVIGYLEGVRLRHDGRAWVDGDAIRVPP
jgi:broad specificity phosphatase PhoE